MRHVPVYFFLLTLIGSVFGQQVKPSNNCRCGGLEIVPSSRSIGTGENVEVGVKAKGQLLRRSAFRWSVSRGEIISGQGTSSVIIRKSHPKVVSPAPRPDTKLDLPPGFVRSEHPIAGPFPFFKGRESKITVRAQLKTKDGCICSASTSIAVKRQDASINEFPNVTDLRLSHNELVHPCEPGVIPREGQKPATSMIVDVITTASDAEDDALLYHYSVSGGVIKESGSKVLWDLTSVPPGTYRITAAVDDGCGLCGKSLTETLTVTECETSCGLVECPTLDISGPRSVKSGDISQFVANISGGGAPGPFTYFWSVDNGEIIEGQGSPAVKVRASQNIDPGTGRGSVSVTLKVGGLDSRGGCIESVTKDFLEEETRPLHQ